MTNIDDLIARLGNPAGAGPAWSLCHEASRALREQRTEIAELSDANSLFFKRYAELDEKLFKAEAERNAAMKDAEVWRHIAQEQYAWLRRAYHGYSHCEDHAAIDAAMKEKS